MHTNSLPAILMYETVREEEALRLANEVFISADPNTLHDIAMYGEFIDNKQEPLLEAAKPFWRALRYVPAYQEKVLPMRGFDRQMDHFDNVFAAEVYRLQKAQDDATDAVATQ